MCQHHACRTDGGNERLLKAIPNLIHSLSTLSAQILDNGILWAGGTGDNSRKLQGFRQSRHGLDDGRNSRLKMYSGNAPIVTAHGRHASATATGTREDSVAKLPF